MGGCPIEGKMYNGKVNACNFLCHPYAKNLLMLTVEVPLFNRPFPSCSVPLSPLRTQAAVYGSHYS